MAEAFLTTVRAETQNAPGPVSLKEAVREAIAEHKFRDTVFIVLDADDKIIASSAEQLLPAGPPAQCRQIWQTSLIGGGASAGHFERFEYKVRYTAALCESL